MATDSSYHFLVKKWSSIDDIEALEHFFGLEFFSDQLKPIVPNLQHYRRVVLLAPHQDDESIGAGGLLQKLHHQNTQISIIYITDGVQTRLSKFSPEEIIQMRFKEVEEALKNIKYDLYKLGISNVRPMPTVDHLKQLIELVENTKPNLILIPWLLDNPVKHRMTNHLLLLANKIKKFSNCEVWGYQVHNQLYPNICIDISDEIEEKIRMVKAYQSQINLGKSYDVITSGMNAYNTKYLPRTKSVEIFFGLPIQKYIEVVNKIYYKDLRKIYKNSNRLLQDVKALEHEVKTTVVV